MRLHRVLQTGFRVSEGFHRVFLGWVDRLSWGSALEFHRVTKASVGFDSVSVGLHEVLSGFIGFYRVFLVLQSFFC